MADQSIARQSFGQRLRSIFGGLLGGRAEGARITDPYAVTNEGWIPMSSPLNYWQQGYDPLHGGWNSVAYACIMLYARTISELPGYHLRTLANGGTETITNSALSRILQKPNAYQTRSDFQRNMIIALLSQGNGYSLALRNQRNEIDSLHQLESSSCRALYGPNADGNPIGEVFYSVGGNPMIRFEDDPAYRSGKRWIIPARDILHICGPSRPSDPLRGESPLIAAGMPIATASAAGGQMTRFFQNMSRPSGVLGTDAVLTTPQVVELRKMWDEQSRGINIGGVPILTAGLKWQQMGMSASEMQVIESMKLSVVDIARIFGVPLALINDMTGATWNNTENLIMVWLRMGLGAMIDQFELAVDKLFEIERGLEYMHFDVDEPLLRPNFKERMDGLKSAMQGGVYAPNEVRRKEGLPSVAHGDEPRVQQQMVPLSAWDQQLNAAPKPAATPAAAPANDNAEDDEEPAEEAERALWLENRQAVARSWIRGGVS